MIYNKIVLTPWGQIYDIDLFRKNNLKYTVGFVHEDVSLTSMALILAHNVQVIDYYGYYYVQTKHSIMRGNNKEERLYRINSVIYQYRFIKNFLRKNVVDAKKRKDIQRFFSKYMIYYSSKLKRKERKLFFKLLEKDNIFNDFDKNKITYKVYFYFVKHTKYARYMLTAINRLTKQIFTKDKNKTFD